jgi:hypothetical protein
MSTRQDLELKLNDLNEKFAFSKKIYEQEIESFKSQLNIAKSTISDLGKKNFVFTCLKSCETNRFETDTFRIYSFENTAGIRAMFSKQFII